MCISYKYGYLHYNYYRYFYSIEDVSCFFFFKEDVHVGHDGGISAHFEIRTRDPMLTTVAHPLLFQRDICKEKLV